MATPTEMVTAINSSNSVSSLATASWTPANNKLYLARVVSLLTGGTAPVTPTVSGNGLTWVQIANPSQGDVSVTSRVTVFRAMVSSGASAGATTADFASETQQGIIIIITEWDGVLTTGTHGSAAVVQVVTNSASTGTSVTATLASFADAVNNAVDLSVASMLNAVPTITLETGYTAFTQRTSTPADFDNDFTCRPGYLIGEDTSPSATLSASAAWIAVALEIADGGGGGGSGVTGDRGFLRGALRGMGRGLTHNMVKVNGLWRPDHRILPATARAA